MVLMCFEVMSRIFHIIFYSESVHFLLQWSAHSAAEVPAELSCSD